MTSSIPPADRDTQPELAVALAELRSYVKRIDANLTMLVEQFQSVTKRQGEHDDRIGKLERRSMNGSEHPAPQGE